MILGGHPAQRLMPIAHCMFTWCHLLLRHIARKRQTTQTMPQTKNGQCRERHVKYGFGIGLLKCYRQWDETSCSVIHSLFLAFNFHKFALCEDFDFQIFAQFLRNDGMENMIGRVARFSDCTENTIARSTGGTENTIAGVGRSSDGTENMIAGVDPQLSVTTPIPYRKRPRYFLSTVTFADCRGKFRGLTMRTKFRNHIEFVGE